jgi:UDPglucose 6-dehydrogenase
MKVCVAGLWHLGTVTAACLASAGHDVTGLDFDETVVARLSAGTPPLLEPGLEELVRTGIAEGRLRFTTAPAAAADADVVWICHDTPVDDDDRPDVELVMERSGRIAAHVRDGALVLISSQLPVGSTRRLEERFRAEAGGRRFTFGYCPENLRLGAAIAAFTQPDRVVAGLRAQSDRERVVELLGAFTRRIEWMSVESAEMTKHALNAFLATSITFINEIAGICEQVGADAAEVERGLKSEARIGPRAYLSPGSAFAGGTLARDVAFLSALGNRHGVATHLLSSIRSSNDVHRQWAQRRLEQMLDGVSGKIVAVWGLTYKPDTDTLRRSSSLELCRWLVEHGTTVRAHDPAVAALPAGLADNVILTESALSAVQGASALVVATPWPVYRHVSADAVATRMTRRLILDPNGFIGETLGRHPGVEYLSVGRHR